MKVSNRLSAFFAAGFLCIPFFAHGHAVDMIYANQMRHIRQLTEMVLRYNRFSYDPATLWIGDGGLFENLRSPYPVVEKLEFTLKGAKKPVHCTLTYDPRSNAAGILLTECNVGKLKTSVEKEYWFHPPQEAASSDDWSRWSLGRVDSLEDAARIRP